MSVIADAQLRECLRLHRAGRLAEAAEAYRKMLATSPNHGECLRGLGMIALQRGEPRKAIEWLDAALRAEPRNAAALSHRADARAALGRQIEAREDYARAIALDPRLCEAHNGLGNVLAGLGHFEEALASYDRAIALDRGFVSALSNRGNVLQHLDRPEEALASYDAAIALAPDFADAHNNRGNVLMRLGRADAASASYRRAIALKPRLASAHNNLGNLLQKRGSLEEALASFERALACFPDFADALNNRGNALRELGRFDEALASYERAIELAPGNASAVYNRCTCRLLLGREKEGWRDYESRWAVKHIVAPVRQISAPDWRGEDLTGRRILLFCEQGLGDAIQFVRFAPLLRGRGCEVTLLVPPKLLRLFRHSMPDIRIVGALDAQDTFDFQRALMSLPPLLGLDSMNIQHPYLKAEDRLVADWRQKLGSQGFKIGVSWQGNPNAPMDKGRSILLEHFKPLAEIGETRLISLQKGAGVEQLSRGFAREGVETLGETLDPGEDAFVDTAAVMSCLDLVVTSDTSIAHLAGALGVPCWVALKFVPDWRWMLEREDSPYYPSLRLFRQRTRGDWSTVFADISRAVEERLRLAHEVFVARSERNLASPTQRNTPNSDL